MKIRISINSYPLLLAMVVLFASCASTTTIQSVPSGAKIYVNGQWKGTTPYQHTDSKIIGTVTAITLKKEGYKDLNFSLHRDEQPQVGPIIGGLFVWVPFLWAMGYEPYRTYELIKLDSIKSTTITPPAASDTINNNATTELIKLKGLLDKGAITMEEFTAIKGSIVADSYDYNNSTTDQLIKLNSLVEAKLLTKEEYENLKKKLIYNN